MVRNMKQKKPRVKRLSVDIVFSFKAGHGHDPTFPIRFKDQLLTFMP